MKLKQLAAVAGKPVPYVMGIQERHGLQACAEYSAGYAVLVRKLTFLAVMSVPGKDTGVLLDRERKLLELLKVDSLDSNPAWFENLCTMKSGPTRLLLSGYDLGRRSGVQPGLDFARREKELFTPREMGADAIRALETCRAATATVIARLRQETPVLADALKWAGKLRMPGTLEPDRSS
jgi:hypothetical protein